jgi:hypothetical protein
MPAASVTPSTTAPESSSTAADSIFSPLPMKFREEPYFAAVYKKTLCMDNLFKSVTTAHLK